MMCKLDPTALAAFFECGPLSGLGGGICGIMGGVFGKSRQKRAEREAAQRLLNIPARPVTEEMLVAEVRAIRSEVAKLRAAQEDLPRVMAAPPKLTTRKAAPRLRLVATEDGHPRAEGVATSSP